MLDTDRLDMASSTVAQGMMRNERSTGLWLLCDYRLSFADADLCCLYCFYCSILCLAWIRSIYLFCLCCAVIAQDLMNLGICDVDT